MTTAQSQVGLDGWIEATVLEIKAALEVKKKQVVEEIVTYPPPIPACDAQFNFLLEERARLTQALSQVERLLDENLTLAERLTLVNGLIDASPELDAEVKQQIRAVWQKAYSLNA